MSNELISSEAIFEKCQYPTCNEIAKDYMTCCSSRHGLALKELRGALIDPDLFSASWHKGIFAQNVLGDRYEDLIFVNPQGSLEI